MGLIDLAVKGYLAVDETIMKGVNAGVRAYNWTTGGTKADLANKMLSVAPIAEACGGSLFLNDPASVVLIAPISIAISHNRQKSNLDVEKKDFEASGQGYINPKVEMYKTRMHVEGLSYPFFGAVFYNMLVNNDSSNQERIGQAVFSSGYIIRGMSAYVMRADSLPPRKNFFRRASDKITEMVDSYRRNRELEPALLRG